MHNSHQLISPICNANSVKYSKEEEAHLVWQNKKIICVLQCTKNYVDKNCCAANKIAHFYALTSGRRLPWKVHLSLNDQVVLNCGGIVILSNGVDETRHKNAMSCGAIVTVSILSPTANSVSLSSSPNGYLWFKTTNDTRKKERMTPFSHFLLLLAGMCHSAKGTAYYNPLPYQIS